MVAFFPHILLSGLDLHLRFHFFHLVLQLVDLGLNGVILPAQLVINSLFVAESHRVPAHFFSLLPFYLLKLLLQRLLLFLLLDGV